MTEKSSINNSSPARTSYAYQHRADLPGAPSKLDRTAQAAPRFADAPEREQGRGSTMVKADRPHPAPRPAPFLALGADRAAFNARWTREAANAAPEEPNRQARREAFKAKRRKSKPVSRARTAKRGQSR